MSIAPRMQEYLDDNHMGTTRKLVEVEDNKEGGTP